LAALRDGFSAHRGCLLGGPKQNGLPDNLYSSAHQIASNFAEQWFRDSTGTPGYFTTNNLAVSREEFLTIGGFNESFPFAQEDREFGARWADHARVSRWVPRAIIVHRHRLTFRTFLRQQFLYGAGAVHFRAARREAQVRQALRFEGLRFHLGLVAAPFQQQGGRRLRLAALLISAQAAYAAGVLAGGASMRRRGE
jgi:GT2 family glycosyltransferase